MCRLIGGPCRDSSGPTRYRLGSSILVDGLIRAFGKRWDIIGPRNRHGSRGIGNVRRRIDPRKPIIGYSQIIRGGGGTGCGPILIQKGKQTGAIRIGQGGGNFGGGGDLHIGGGGQGVGTTALAGQGQQGKIHIISSPHLIDKVGAGNDQSPG